MPEWINVGERSLYNLDHVIAIHRGADGMAELVLTVTKLRIKTDTPYDEIFLWIIERGRTSRTKRDAVRIE